MGSIITVVAVFEIHIERNAVATINPRRTLETLLPIIEIMVKAILLCKFHFSTANAKIKPPMNRNIILFPYDSAVFERSIIPNSGKRTIGSNEVTAIGIASVIHQMAIQITVSKRPKDFSFIDSGGPIKNKKVKTTGPKKMNMFFFSFNGLFDFSLIRKHNSYRFS